MKRKLPKQWAKEARDLIAKYYPLDQKVKIEPRISKDELQEWENHLDELLESKEPGKKVLATNPGRPKNVVVKKNDEEGLLVKEVGQRKTEAQKINQQEANQTLP